MQKIIAAFISVFAIGLILVASTSYFKNTEAFLNGRHHFDESRHHDYDQNGKKESTHHKHGNPVSMIKLTFVSQLSKLIIIQSPVLFESSTFPDEGPLKTSEYISVIFRPPILA